MPRRAKVSKRILLPDAKYNSELVSKFINKIMQRGKPAFPAADHRRQLRMAFEAARQHRPLRGRQRAEGVFGREMTIGVRQPRLRPGLGPGNALVDLVGAAGDHGPHHRGGGVEHHRDRLLAPAVVIGEEQHAPPLLRQGAEAGEKPGQGGAAAGQSERIGRRRLHLERIPGIEAGAGTGHVEGRGARPGHQEGERIFPRAGRAGLGADTGEGAAHGAAGQLLLAQDTQNEPVELGARQAIKLFECADVTPCDGNEKGVHLSRRRHKASRLPRAAAPA